MAPAARARRPYDWEERYTQDPRTGAMREAVDRILITSFPSISERLAKHQAPKQRQETAPALAQLATVKPETKTMMEPEYIDPNAYKTEESSDEDAQEEVDPMEKLREMEQRMASGRPALDEPRHSVSKPNGGAASAEKPVEENGGGDVEMAEDEEEEEEATACLVCQKPDNEKQILLCDRCDGEYHMYCLSPPLTSVPPGEWFCPACIVIRNPATSIPTSTDPAASTTASAAADAESSDMDVDDMSLSGEVVRIKQERERAMGWVPADQSPPPEAATSVSIAQTFEQDAQKSNELLVHACNCDAVNCRDAQFHEFCGHMKRFLRSACWASHNSKWMTYRIATATAELLAYHSLHCDVPQCNVPMCDELRAEEYV